MSALWQVIAPLLSAVASSAAIVWFARRAIDHAFVRALADRRAEFEESLQKKGQAFSRELEEQRQAATQALERFRTDLMLGAEVRRHAAARKVDGLLKIDEATTALLRVFLDMGNKQDDRMQTVRAWAAVKVQFDALMSETASAELRAFLNVIREANQTLNERELPGVHVDPIKVSEAHASIELARVRLVRMIRVELFVAEASSEARAQVAGEVKSPALAAAAEER